MSADERTLADRVANMLVGMAAADSLHFGEIDAVAAILREQQAEIERLTLALKKQAASALMGMDAAKAIAASNVREAARLYAESNPSAIDSERTANQLLTDEIDSLRRDLEALKQYAGHMGVWCSQDSGHACTCGLDALLAACVRRSEG